MKYKRVIVTGVGSAIVTMLRFGILLSAAVCTPLVSLPAARALRSKSPAGVVVLAGAVSAPTLPRAQSAGLRGPYLGQIPPGEVPARFAPEVIKGDLHSAPAFAPNGNEVYWALQGGKLLTMKLQNGSWTQPERVAFSASMTDYRDPFIAPSGARLFFLSKGRLPDSRLPEKENIWSVQRTRTGWGEPQPLSDEVNAHDLHWQVSVDNDGDIYFTSRNTGCEDIYRSRYVDGRHLTPERLSDSVNTDDLCETTPYVAPDRSYLIFSRWDRNNANAPNRLHISYADGKGGWSKAVLIERVPYGLCPLVSPDGKYLFFLSSPQGVSWMSAGFITRALGIGALGHE